MIKRIVKLTFEPALVPDFMQVFESSKASIRAFEGCLHMELLQHTSHQHILFTLSYWEDEIALERYRNSTLFQTTWQRTKVLFADKPEAWTVVVLDAPL